MLEVIEVFKKHNVDLSVYVIDMDWHITETGNESRGWTGYTFNTDLIPDPQKLLKDLHDREVKVTLNLHPADGVWPHEIQYFEFAQRQGVQFGNPIPFDCQNPLFLRDYFELLHHPLEDLGVDFWWIDWQQGTGDLIDPLIVLNHLHFADIGRDGTKRPLILSRWCGLGGHRYPIGFSGDTTVEWISLQFQPYFTATAANPSNVHSKIST
jgi:alpha-glucosidase (family GH31 glycosyl hydrolase)